MAEVNPFTVCYKHKKYFTHTFFNSGLPGNNYLNLAPPTSSKNGINKSGVRVKYNSYCYCSVVVMLRSSSLDSVDIF